MNVGLVWAIIAIFQSFTNMLNFQTVQHFDNIISMRRMALRNRLRKRRFLMLNHMRQMQQRAFLQAIPFIRLRHRSICARPRSNDWWISEVLKSYSDVQWKENFRMSQANFLKLCAILEPDLRPQPGAFHKVLSVQQKVAIALYKLSTCGEYRTVGNQFGVHKSTVHCVLHEFCTAVSRRLTPQLIKFPNAVECQEIAFAFQQTCKLPQIIGAIDGSHIPCTPPKDGYKDYVNRKGWPSMVLQAIVDNQGLFRDVTCKHPGCCHDSTVLSDSNIFKNNKNLIPQESKELEGVQIPLMLLGDGGYALQSWILTPHRNPQEATHESFNVYHSNGRICVEQAFGRLKGRWRILLKRIEADVDFVPLIVITCCTLHNFVELNKEGDVPTWKDDVKAAEAIYPQPRTGTQGRENFNASIIREHLTKYLADNFKLRQSSLRYDVQRNAQQ